MSEKAVSASDLKEEPYYLPIEDEVELFLAAYKQRLPVLLKGPTGCGKTRFVEYMAHLIYRKKSHVEHAGWSVYAEPMTPY